MNFKKISALFGLVVGAMVLFSFTYSSNEFTCSMKLTNSSTTTFAGVSVDGDNVIVPKNDPDNGFSGETTVTCPCAGYVWHVTHAGTITWSLDGSAPRSLGGGDYEYYPL